MAKISCVRLTNEMKPDAMMESLRYAGLLSRRELMNGVWADITILPPRYVGSKETPIWASQNQARMASFGIKSTIVVKDLG